MPSLFRLAATLAASLSLLCGGSALAAGTTSASLSNLQLGTLDLTPDDGIMPGYTIDAVSPFLAAYFFAEAADSTQESYPDPYQPDSVRVDYGPSFGEARTGGALGDLSTNAAAHANLGDFGFAGAFSEQLVWLTLQPHTVLTVGGHFTTSAERMVDSADYDAYSRVSVTLADENFHVVTELWRSSGAWPNGDMAHALDEDFLLTYANGTDQDMLVSLYLSTWSDIIVLAPVPEPGTWAMLSAGLLLLGGAARRRRRHG